MTRGSAAVASTTWVVCLCVVTHPRSLTRSLSLLLCCRVVVLPCCRVAVLPCCGRRRPPSLCAHATRDTQTLPLPLRFVCMLLTLLFSLTCMLCCCCCFCVRHSPSLAHSLGVCLCCCVAVLLCCCIAVLLCARRVGGRLRRDTQPQPLLLSLRFVCADFRPRCLHVRRRYSHVHRRCSYVCRRCSHANTRCSHVCPRFLHASTRRLHVRRRCLHDRRRCLHVHRRCSIDCRAGYSLSSMVSCFASVSAHQFDARRAGLHDACASLCSFASMDCG